MEEGSYRGKEQDDAEDEVEREWLRLSRKNIGCAMNGCVAKTLAGRRRR
jgi:hypothetical protein